MRRRSIPACIAVISAIMFVFPDRAWSTDALSAAQLNEARERFSEGRKLEEAGRFDEALVAFRQVARVKTTPQVRFHIALCLMHTNQPVAAIEEFHTAISEAGTTAPNVVAEAKQHIATLEKQVGVVTIEVSGADMSELVVTFDGRVETPEKQIFAIPGRHVVELIQRGQTVEKRAVSVGAGEHARVALNPTAATPDEPADEPTNGRRIGSYVTFGVAGLGVIGVGTFALLRADRLAKLEADCPTFTGCARSLEPVVREGKTYSAAVNVMGGVGIAAAIVGTILYVSSPSKQTKGSAGVGWNVLPVAGPDAGFVMMNGRF